VGRKTATDTTEICEVQNDPNENEKIKVPKDFELSIRNIIKRIKDIFAKTDSDLGLTRR
jgi:hypothetical protein